MIDVDLASAVGFRKSLLQRGAARDPRRAAYCHSVAIYGTNVTFILQISNFIEFEVKKEAL